MRHDYNITPFHNNWDDTRRSWLALAWFDGFGCRTLHKLHAQVKDAAWDIAPTRLLEFGCKPHTVERFLEYRARTDPHKLAESLDEMGIQFVLITDDDYPPLLRQISDPPVALFVRGSLEGCKRQAVAVVGTRRNTPYGKRAAEWIGEELAKHGVTIVSGLAGGIDTIVHETGVRAGTTCLAVLGSGIDEGSIYPRSNLALSKRIIEAGGALISEFGPGTEGLKHHFPLRNRLISGLSRATVVVEAAEKSGSLITAHFALEQNRDVFSVPGPITSDTSGGTNRLLAMGAIPCTSPEDITRLFATTIPLPLPKHINLEPEEKSLLRLLDSPHHTDDLARALKLSIARINTLLMRLEIHGYVASQGAHIYIRTHAAPDDES